MDKSYPGTMLNDYQLQQLREYVADEQELEAAGFEDEQGEHRILGVRSFPCKVPGMVAATTQDGIVLKLLYPVPRPIPCDPQFQHAEPLDKWSRTIVVRVACGRTKDMFNDWQWEGCTLDAPWIMPSGSCHSFSYEKDVYGATQTTHRRSDED